MPSPQTGEQVVILVALYPNAHRVQPVVDVQVLQFAIVEQSMMHAPAPLSKVYSF